MSSVTYLILLHNNSENLHLLTESMKQVTCPLRKEYIIIDDASTDNTKSLAQNLFSSFPRTTIISNEQYSGPALSINSTMRLIQGEYIHFVFGGETLDPTSTQRLLNGCAALGTELAFGLKGKIDSAGSKHKSIHETGDIILVETPIKAVLEDKIADIDTIGYSGTLMSSRLLQKIAGTDISLFLHNMSLTLRAGKYSKFAAIKETLYYELEDKKPGYDKRFENLENLYATSNFIEAHPEIAEHYIPEIYRALWALLWKLDKYNIKTIPKYLLSRYLSRNLELSELIQLYRNYIDKLC